MLIFRVLAHSLTESDDSAPEVVPLDVGAVYAENVRYVWRVLTHLGIPPSDLEDVCHDVFVVAQRRAPDFAGRSSVRTWIYGIALRTASDYRKRAFRRYERCVEQVPETSDSEDQHEQLERAALRDRLGALLGQLPDAQREVFVLYEVEELPMREVAEAIGCPLQTAYSRLHAARRSMLEALGADGGAR